MPRHSTIPSRNCILIEADNKKKKIPWRPGLENKNCQNLSQSGILRSETGCTIFSGECLRLKAPPNIAFLGDVRIFISPRNSKARMTFKNDDDTKFEETICPLLSNLPCN